ncbi:MAG: ATP-binding protein [Ornithinimicrobium sp.]
MIGDFLRGNTVASMLQRLSVVLILVLGLTIAIGIASVNSIQDQITDFRQNVTPAVDESGRLSTALTLAQSNFRGFIYTQDPVLLEDYRDQRQEIGDLEESLATRTEIVDSSTTQALIQQTDDWFELTTTLMREVDDAGPQDLTIARRSYEDIMSANVRLNDQILQTRDELRDDYRRAMSRGKLAILVAGLLGTAAVMASTRRVGTRLAAPLSGLRDVVQRHQRGDTEVRAPVDQGSAEVQSVAAAFNRLADAQEVAERLIQEDLELTRMVGAVSSILTASVTDESHWDEACLELGRSLQLDCVAITAHQELPTAQRLGHWGCVGHRQGETGTSGFASPLTLGGQAGQHLFLAGTSEEIEQTFPPLAVEKMRRHGAQSGALAVLSESDRVLGVLTLVSTQPREWHEREVAAVGQVASNTTQFLVQRQVVERLRELDRQKSDFMSTTSHELRTPLTSISGYLEMLEDGDLGQLNNAQRQALGVLGRNVNRLRTLIEDLLILNRLDSGKGRVVRERIDLRRSVQEVIQNLDPIAARKNVDLSGPESGLDEVLQHNGASTMRECYVLGDRDQIERALTNVVGNAVKFTPSDGSVSVQIVSRDARVEVVCEDSGIGIPDEELKDLFVRFFRASNAVVGQVPGSGLGLSIVLAIVEGHQGTVDVSSNEGRGTRVRISLPAADTED